MFRFCQSIPQAITYLFLLMDHGDLTSINLNRAVRRRRIEKILYNDVFLFLVALDLATDIQEYPHLTTLCIPLSHNGETDVKTQRAE